VVKPLFIFLNKRRIDMAENTKVITLNDFIEKYDGRKSADTKNLLLKSIIKRTYIPYAEKVSICGSIVKVCYTNNDGDLNSNSSAAYMLYRLKLVENYTYLIIDYNDAPGQYDLLASGDRIFDVLMSFIPEPELDEMRTVMESITSDLHQNQYEIHNYINRQVERFANLFGNITNETIMTILDVLEKEDSRNKISDFVNKIRGIIK